MNYSNINTQHLLYLLPWLWNIWLNSRIWVSETWAALCTLCLQGPDETERGSAVPTGRLRKDSQGNTTQVQYILLHFLFRFTLFLSCLINYGIFSPHFSTPCHPASSPFTFTIHFLLLSCPQSLYSCLSFPSRSFSSSASSFISLVTERGRYRRDISVSLDLLLDRLRRS